MSDKWQPIDTAPKGAAIVYDAKKGVIPDAYLHDNDGRASYGYYRNIACHVTHWMPLPEAPDAE